MKTLRLLFFFLLAVIITTAALSFFQATYQQVKRSVVINASAEKIYDKLVKLENFNRFSIWTQEDSSATVNISGKDGTTGASLTWKGHPEISGEGKITIKALSPNKRVEHQLEFTEPKKANASSVFSLEEMNKGVTTVTWVFQLATPRPWNVFNLFYSLDKNKGKDFEDGLAALKLLVEQQ